MQWVDLQMTNRLLKDVVVDTNVIRLYETPDDPIIKAFFLWIRDHGTLTVSKKLLVEYFGIGNRDLAGLINRLSVVGRLKQIDASYLRAFSDDRHYTYTCNYKDRWHARLVFLSVRKLLVAGDKNLINDVNGFRKVDGIKPQATKSPKPDFYS